MKSIAIAMNNLRALYALKQGRTTAPTLPTFVWLEPTNRCNLRCVMCPNGTGMVRIEKGAMTLEDYTRTLDAIAPFTSAVTLAINGESLLHPQFTNMVRHASQRGVKVMLNTNATLLTPELSRELLESGLRHISFAFDGFNAEQYERARRGADFHETLENILHFLRLKKQLGRKTPYCVLSILKLDLASCAESEREAFLSRFEGLVDEVRLREVASWGSTFKDTDEFSTRRHEGLYLPCSRLWNTTAIAWNGDVLPCIYDANHEHVLGNIHEQSFPSIWNGEAMRTLRHAMLEGEHLKHMPLCENCIVIGTPPVLGIPSGLRLTMTDAAVNFCGYGFENYALKAVNTLRGGSFSATRIR